MEYLHRQYPKYVELVHIGQSYEGRHLIIAKISFDDEAEEYSKNQPLFMYKKKQLKKSGVFIEAGSHAREWITPAVATYIMDTIIKGITKNGLNKYNLKKKMVLNLQYHYYIQIPRERQFDRLIGT